MHHGKNILFDITWDVNKYKTSYDSEHWDLCRTFMETHKTKYPEQKIVHLTEAFYQIGVYGSSYDPKTTRMVSALSIEVLEKFLELHPGTLKHPFKKAQTDENKGNPTMEGNKDENQKTNQSIWDVSVDSSIIVNVLPRVELESLLKGFVNIYDIRKVSTMNDNKVSILEESFKRSKFGPCHWHKEITNDIFSPIRLSVKWKGSLLAQAEGKDESTLKTRIAQALLSKLAVFSPGIEAKWNYYRDGRIPEIFENPNPRRSHLYKILRRSDFKAMEEITSFVDTFANSNSLGEIVFGMDFSSQDKKHILDYIEKSWGSKLTHRTVNKPGLKGKGEVTHLCIYQNRTGEELKRWLDQDGGENIRYRLVPPGEHRRAGASDENVREVLKSASDGSKNKESDENNTSKGVSVSQENKKPRSEPKSQTKLSGKADVPVKERSKVQDAKTTGNPDDLGNVFKEFVLFYNADKESKIDKDDWFSALCDSFKISEYGPLEVLIENIRPIRTKCTLKWKEMTLASAEGLTETQAKTGATLQLIAKMESFTYIIQAKDEYFVDGKVPSFIEKLDEKKSDFFRVYKREELPSYYTIFQTIDDFVNKQSYGEIIFGQDFTWDLKNEILVYLKAKGLEYRTFTSDNQDPPTHIAVFHAIKPAELKMFLLENGGENEKFKLIPPPKIEPPQAKPDQAQNTKDKQVEKPPLPTVEPPKEDQPPPPPLKTPPKVGEKRKLPEKEKEPEPEPEVEANKIQINLKKFKKDKVEYPEDTGGDFPGLILWLGITKNSRCQRSLYINLIESFKFSKYGELTVEESEENVWGRKEPFKKCVIKSGRKVLAVGLGESKTEAKNSASLQVLRLLRKHCYTIQAKESYFKDGKAPPYDVTPDPKKENVYRLAKKEQFKDKASLIRFVDNFSKQVSEGEVIFGDDFTYEEREIVSEHCNKINLCYRLMKCQSVNKGQHSHVAIYHQRPPPAVKADLMKAGGENDLYRLISPGQKITKPNSDNDMWPDTLEDENQKAPIDSKKNPSVTSNPIPVISSNPTTAPKVLNGQKDNTFEATSMGNIGDHVKGNRTRTRFSNVNPEKENPLGKQQPAVQVPVGPTPVNLANQPPFPGPQPPPNMFGPGQVFIPNPPVQEMPLVFGPQPMVYLPLPPENMPLQFQNMPMEMSAENMPIQMLPQNMPLPPPGGMMMGGGDPSAIGMNNEIMQPQMINDEPNQRDLREELNKKRQGSAEWNERKVTKQEGDGWSRNVFMGGDSNQQNMREKRQDNFQAPERGRGRGRGRFMRGRGRGSRFSSADKPPNTGERFSPERQNQRFSSQKRGQRFSPGRQGRRFSPERKVRSPERRERSPSYERRFPRRDRSFSRSPSPYRDGTRRRRSPSPRLRRSISPGARYRDLWDNISERYSESIFMYRYVKQDSTVETDPFALLRSTRSPDFNVDFDFITVQVSIDEWQVSVELVTNVADMHPLVGEGVGHTEDAARLTAARHAIDTVEKACRTVEPNFSYFADGMEPDFIIRKSPMKTHLYEIIQNLDPSQPVDRMTVDFMLNAFIHSEMEDIFFLANDFSYMERSLVVELADQKNLWWRLFGRRHPEAPPNNIVSTQHICVFKQRSALEIVSELIMCGGRTEKYSLVDRRLNQGPREPNYRQPRGRGRGRGRGGYNRL